MNRALPINSMRFIKGDTWGMYLFRISPEVKAPTIPSTPMASDAAAAKAAEEPVPEEKAEKKVKTTKKTPAKKAPVKKATAKKAAAPKTAVKKVSVSAPVFIQSPLGGEITPAEVLSKVPAGADKIYIRVDQNKAYWVKGEETGSVDLW